MDGICYRCVEEGTAEAAPESSRDAIRLCLRHALHLLEELRHRLDAVPAKATIGPM